MSCFSAISERRPPPPPPATARRRPEATSAAATEAATPTAGTACAGLRRHPAHAGAAAIGVRHGIAAVAHVAERVSATAGSRAGACGAAVACARAGSAAAGVGCRAGSVASRPFAGAGAIATVPIACVARSPGRDHRRAASHLLTAAAAEVHPLLRAAGTVAPAEFLRDVAIVVAHAAAMRGVVLQSVADVVNVDVAVDVDVVVAPAEAAAPGGADRPSQRRTRPTPPAR